MQTRVQRIVPTEKLLVQIDKYIKPRTKDIAVFEGAIVFLHPSNIKVINPIKIFVRKAEKVYVVMHYGEYSKDKNDIYLYTKNNKISWLKLIEILKSA